MLSVECDDAFSGRVDALDLAVFQNSGSLRAPSRRVRARFDRRDENAVAANERRAAFDGYQVNDEVMTVANEGCMVMHCLPAHRGEEITGEVFEAHANEIFDEAENRLHAQKAVLVKLMKG